MNGMIDNIEGGKLKRHLSASCFRLKNKFDHNKQQFQLDLSKMSQICDFFFFFFTKISLKFVEKSIKIRLKLFKSIYNHPFSTISIPFQSRFLPKNTQVTEDSIQKLQIS